MGKPADRSRTASTCLSTPAALEIHLDAIHATGGSVLRDPVAGIATATDSAGTAILRAIRKGRRGHWILMFYNSKTVKWEPTTPTEPRR